MRSKRGNIARNMDFCGLILDMNCDNNTASLVDRREDAPAGYQYVLEPGLLNRSHHGCSDIWSMPCYSIIVYLD